MDSKKQKEKGRKLFLSATGQTEFYLNVAGEDERSSKRPDDQMIRFFSCIPLMWSRWSVYRKNWFKI